MPAMIIGGKSLGFAHNKFVSGSFTVNQFWGLIGPSLGYTSTAAPFAAVPSPVNGEQGSVGSDALSISAAVERRSGACGGAVVRRICGRLPGSARRDAAPR